MISQLAIIGDSLSTGFPTGSAMGDGRQGGWDELLAEGLANISGLGPMLSSGYRGVANGIQSFREWSYAGTWTTVTNANLWDKLPYGFGKTASGAGSIATFTRPIEWRTPVGFKLYWVDLSTGGNWQYRIDGGSWINMGQTLAHDSKICAFYVPTPFTDTIDIRAFDGTSSAGCFPAGIELFWSDPTAPGASGLIVHHYAVGSQNLHKLFTSIAGDRMAIMDSVKLGTGSPIVNAANICTLMMHINDVKDFGNTTTWANDLTSFNSRVSPLGPVAFMNPYETVPTTFNATTQSDYRAQTKTTAAGFATPAKVLDLYDLWTANGWGTGVGTQNDVIQAAGLTFDNIHETLAGHLDLYFRIYWWIRTQILSGLNDNTPSRYPMAAKQTAIQYSGKQAGVQYSAGAPITVSTRGQPTN